MSGPRGPNPEEGPPYAPQGASIGGQPTVGLDVPICAVLLAIFVGGAVGHMTTFQLNKRKGHKFILSLLMFGFCMARIVTMIMRIVWATRPRQVPIAIAAQVFVSAGVLLLFIVNLLFAQRILRAAHPRFGWSKAVSICFLALFALIIISLVMVIVASVQSFHTLNRNTRRIDRNIQLSAATYFAFITFLPIPIVLLSLVAPRRPPLEKFGLGRWRNKIRVLLAGAVLLCLGASFRCGTSFKGSPPSGEPAWYHAKWCFYLFNFAIEIIVVYLYMLVRVDQRFHIPNGSKQPGDYSGRSGDVTKEQILLSETQASARGPRRKADPHDVDLCDCEDGEDGRRGPSEERLP